MADEQAERPVGSENQGAVNRYWNNLAQPARLGIIFIVSLSLLIIIIMSVNRAAPRQMEVLFHRLDLSQARDVTAKLDEMNVPYELADDGSTLLVPKEQRDRLRLSLSPELYSQGIGFALFENGGLVSSDFDRRVQWQIALEEELRRTITSIDAVDQARVHLVISEESLFIRERKEPSASVLLKLRPLTTLSDTQVRGILSLVAGSVESLEPQNVTIINSKGEILYDAFSALEEMSASNLAESQMFLKRQFEAELEKRLRFILEQVYGPGRAVAMVSADLDFDTRERTVVTYHEEPVSRSTHRMEERSENTGPPAAEVGEPNIPGQAAVLTGGGDSSYDRIEEIVNYEVGETRDYIATAPGQVLRLSTAIVIDNDGNDPFIIGQVEALVNSAIGFNQGRGDNVTVHLLPFDTTWIDDSIWEPVPIPEEVQFPVPIPMIGAALLALLIIIFAIVIFKSQSKRREQLELEQMSLEKQMQAKLREEEMATEAGEAESKARTIRKLVKEEPESVASLLRTWLVEE